MKCEPLYKKVPVDIITHCPDCGGQYNTGKGHSCDKEPFSSQLWQNLEILRMTDFKKAVMVFDKLFPNL
jgi:predicted  nucleic acid-binding Zn-ribbon protein